MANTLKIQARSTSGSVNAPDTHTRSSTTASGSKRRPAPSPSSAAASTSTSRYPIPPEAHIWGDLGPSPSPFAGSGHHSSSGGGSTTNKLETSKFVLSALKEVDVYISKREGMDKEVSVPIGDAARHAVGILEIIREIAHDNVDENLSHLALESCGLVYIVMDSCREELNNSGEISDRTKVDLGGLTSNLSAIQTFVHKHVTRSFTKRLLKHGDDSQMIMVQREKLKYWLTRFLGNEHVNETMSIHDVLDRLVQQQLARANTRKGRPSAGIPVPPASNRHGERKPTRRNTWMVNKPLPVPEVLQPTPSERLIRRPDVQEKNQHQRISETDGGDHPTITQPLIRALPSSPAKNVQTHSRTVSREEKELQDAELRRKARLERQKVERMAERARWLKSEEEFNKLPMSSDIEGLVDGASSNHTGPTPSSQRLQRPRPPPISLPRTDRKGRIVLDLELERGVAEVHKQAQRETVEEVQKEAKANLEVEDRWLKPERRSVESVGSSMYAAPQSPRPPKDAKNAGGLKY